MEPLLDAARVGNAPKGAVERFAFERELHTGRVGVQPGTPSYQPTAIIHRGDADAAVVDTRPSNQIGLVITRTATDAGSNRLIAW